MQETFPRGKMCNIQHTKIDVECPEQKKIFSKKCLSDPFSVLHCPNICTEVLLCCVHRQHTVNILNNFGNFGICSSQFYFLTLFMSVQSEEIFSQTSSSSANTHINQKAIM